MGGPKRGEGLGGDRLCLESPLARSKPDTMEGRFAAGGRNIYRRRCVSLLPPLEHNPAQTDHDRQTRVRQQEERDKGASELSSMPLHGIRGRPP